MNGDTVDEADERQPEELDTAAQQRRRVLWERHARLRSIELGSDLDKTALDELFALTDEVLGLERRALERRALDDHRSSSRWIYGATGALVVGSGSHRPKRDRRSASADAPSPPGRRRCRPEAPYSADGDGDDRAVRPGDPRGPRRVRTR